MVHVFYVSVVLLFLFLPAFTISLSDMIMSFINCNIANHI